MVSSYIPELLGLCDRIAVMQAGKLVEVGEADRVMERGRAGDGFAPLEWAFALGVLEQVGAVGGQATVEAAA